MLEMRNNELKIDSKIGKEVTIIICYERILNDRNGNPRYTLSFFWNELNLNSMLHDNYKYKINKNGYLIIMSYNINSTIGLILKDIKNYFENNL